VGKIKEVSVEPEKCPLRLCVNCPSINPDACHQLSQCKRRSGRHAKLTRKSGHLVPASFQDQKEVSLKAAFLNIFLQSLKKSAASKGNIF